MTSTTRSSDGPAASSACRDYDAPPVRRIRASLSNKFRHSVPEDERLAALDDAYIYATRTYNGDRPFPASFYYVSVMYLRSAARRSRERAERERVVGRVHPGMSSPTPCPRLVEAMFFLPPEEEEAVRLSFSGGMTLTEIGEVQRCSRETARRRLHSALRHLRELCEP